MKAVKRTKLIEISFWDCGNPKHNHGTKDVAEHCIEKQKRMTGHIRISQNQYKLRNIKVARMLIGGASLKKAGTYIGRSTATARACLYRALRATNVATGNWRTGDPYYFDTIKEVQEERDFWLPALDELERKILAEEAAGE